jgi:hypothetical protein
LEFILKAVQHSDALESEHAENKQLEDAAAGKTVTLKGWARLWWNLFAPGSGILVQFHKLSVILDGDKKVTRMKEKVLKIICACHDTEELKKARSRHLPNSIALGALLLQKYKASLKKVKAASKKKATEDKRLQILLVLWMILLLVL